MLLSSGVSWYTRWSRLIWASAGADGEATLVRARNACTGSAPMANWAWFVARKLATSVAVAVVSAIGMTPRLTWSARTAVGKAIRTCAASSAA